MRLKNNIYTKRSLFKKYLNVSLVVIISSFILLGLILIFTMIQYWNNTKKSEFDRTALSVSKFIGSNVIINASMDNEIAMYYDNVKLLEQSLTMFANNIDGDVFVTDLSGRVVLMNQGSKYISESTRVNQELIDTVIQSHYYFGQGTMNNVYDTTRYIAVRPIYYADSSSMVGAVFVTSDASQINAFSEIMLRIFALSAFAALAISILAIGIFSYNMVKPLRQMADAARKFGKGDFSVRVNESSNDEVGDLAVAFNNMADSLASSENVRKSFVANVSHELKTPMTTIAGFIDGILDGTIPPERQKHYLGIVSDEIRRLSRLVRSMLDLSRIDSGEMRLNYQQFDIVSILVTVLLTFEQEIDKRKIEIRGLDNVKAAMVYGDPDLIHQVIYNLIENAVKFTEENGYIEFEIEDWSDRTVFAVKNSGKGIEKEELALIFERFYKTDKSRSKDKKGLGLGLYLVRTIVRLHGGEITADSVLDEYCRFSFFVPKKQDNSHKTKN